MTGLAATTLSIAVIAALLLGGAGLWLMLSRRQLKRGLLMLVAGLVIFGNVLIWTLPL